MAERDSTEGFEFTEWAKQFGLKRKATEALHKEEFDKEEILKNMRPEDIAHLDIARGQAVALRLALA